MRTTRSAFPLPRPSRPVWFVIGATATVAAVAIGSPWLLLAWIAPDLAILAVGVKSVDAHGRMSPRAVRGYNATHALVGPAAVGLAGALGSRALLAVAALWLSHIAIDRSLGYGPRAADGSQRG